MAEPQEPKNPWDDFQAVRSPDREKKKAGGLSKLVVFLIFVALGTAAGGLFAYLTPLMGTTRYRARRNQTKTVAQVNRGAEWRVPIGAVAGGLITAVGLVRLYRRMG